MLIRLRKDLIQLYSTFAIVQALRDDDKGEATKDAFERFRDTVMPYLKKESVKAQQEVIDRLREEIARGPLSVRQLPSSSQTRSRLKEIVRKIKTQPPVRWSRRRR